MKTRLSAVSLAIGLGIAKGIWMIAFAWAVMYWGFGTDLLKVIASAYYHYDATLIGGLWGGLWGLIEGIIFGLIIAWFYNLCMCCCCRNCN